MSVICQAVALNRRFIVQLGQDAVFPGQSLSIKRNLNTSPVNSLFIADTKGNAGSDSSSDDKRQESSSCGFQRPLIESISWQLLYASHLLVAYQLTLTTRDVLLSYDPYSWLPEGWFVAVPWLLDSYWNPGSPLFSPIEQQGGQKLPFAAITAMFGSGHNQQLYQPLQSSGQQTSQATSQCSGSLISPVSSGSGDGDRGPQQYLHTLGLNCFVYPCYGICRFRSSSDSREPAEWLLESLNGSCPRLANRHCYNCISYFDSEQLSGVIDSTFTDEVASDGVVIGSIVNKTNAIWPLSDVVPMHRHFSFVANDFVDINEPLGLQNSFEGDEAFFRLSPSETQQTTTELSRLDQSQSYLSQTGTIQASVAAENVIFGARHCQQTDSDDKAGQIICKATVSVEGGQQRPCEKVCNNAKSLLSHKRRYHTGKRVCKVSVIGKYGQQQPCWTVCKNVQALLHHRRTVHTGQQICNLIVIGKDGQRRPCGKICKNAHTLSNHKCRVHSGQQICVVTLVGKDGQQRPCGTVCNNYQALVDHKKKDHSEQQTCDVNVMGMNGQQRPCGRVCKSYQALGVHKSKRHTGQQICDVTMVGGDGQQRPCGKICKNSGALYDHKRKHHKRKPDDVGQSLRP
ncbi:hypothetical protein [Endozoicomonas sp. 8E]|uniref:hypothetical protein n=1 Tax=Endozoicomonas sp. 8E TaxID=3035692 RepID=UPI00293944D4|nr:hypothetical protein [Endozoicomonas sp. 8E]WOG29014.1 hypothetical protein P6910_04950 [Endozoicomonas sp. 8E]